MAIKKPLVLGDLGTIEQLQDGDSIDGLGGNYTELDTAPIDPTAGDEWFHTTTGILYKFVSDGTSSFWLDISGSGVTILDGGAP